MIWTQSNNYEFKKNEQATSRAQRTAGGMMQLMNLGCLFKMVKMGFDEQTEIYGHFKWCWRETLQGMAGNSMELAIVVVP